MKRFLSAVLIAVMVMASASSALAAAEKTKVSQSLVMPGGGSTIADVFMDNGTTMLPLDDLIFFMGWTKWMPAGSEQWYFGARDKSISATVFPNSAKAIVNDKEISLSVPTYTYKDRLYVPLSSLCSQMGYIVYWRQADMTIYIQSPSYREEVTEIMTKSLEAVNQQTKLVTTYDNKTGMHYYADNYTLESTGKLEADFAKNVARDLWSSNLYNERTSTQYNRNPVESYTTEEYITANGIYRLENGTYKREPVPAENISTMDVASKSVFTDPLLFLNSAKVSKDEEGNPVVKAQTDVGVLLKVGCDIYLPEQTDTLVWSNTYQTVTYDKDTYLPKKMELYLHATYIPDPSTGEKMLLIYNYQYNFDFNGAVSLTLPSGVQ